MSTPAEWYYATQTDVEDAISAAGLSIVSNMENTTARTNTDRVGRAGSFADAYMDARFAAMGFPLTNGHAFAKPFATIDGEILAQLSVYIVATQLVRWRIIQTIDPMGNAQGVLKKVSDEWQSQANALFSDIQNNVILLSTPRQMTGPSDNTTAVDSTGLPMYPQRPPLIWWPFPGPLP